MKGLTRTLPGSGAAEAAPRPPRPGTPPVVTTTSTSSRSSARRVGTTSSRMSGRMLPWVTCTTGRVEVRTSSHHGGGTQAAGGSGRRAPTQCTVAGRSAHGVLERRRAGLQVQHRRDRGLEQVEAVGRQAHRRAQPVVALLRPREHPAPRRLAHRVVAQPGHRAAHRQQPRPERGGRAVGAGERPVAEGRGRHAERLGEQRHAVAQRCRRARRRRGGRRAPARGRPPGSAPHRRRARRRPSRWPAGRAAGRARGTPRAAARRRSRGWPRRAPASRPPPRCPRGTGGSRTTAPRARARPAARPWAAGCGCAPARGRWRTGSGTSRDSDGRRPGQAFLVVRAVAAFFAVVFLAAVLRVVVFLATLRAVFFTGPRARLSASSS